MRVLKKSQFPANCFRRKKVCHSKSYLGGSLSRSRGFAQIVSIRLRVASQLVRFSFTIAPWYPFDCDYSARCDRQRILRYLNRINYQHKKRGLIIVAGVPGFTKGYISYHLGCTYPALRADVSPSHIIYTIHIHKHANSAPRR